MAQKVTVQLVDDMDGKKADETVTFGMDGVTYEIDLGTKNATKLREQLAPYMDAGRRTGGRSARGKARVSSADGGDLTAKIRAWAKDKGYEVNDRGRIPATVREAYEKAHA